MKLFPTHISIILKEDERSALDELFDLDAQLEDEVELVHRAIQEGIKALNRGAESRRMDPDGPPTRSQMEAQTRTEKKARRLTPESGVVESYVASPITGEMQRRLESFLVTHPDMGEEEAVRHLLDMALRSAEGDKQTTLDRAADRARLTLLRHGYRT